MLSILAIIPRVIPFQRVFLAKKPADLAMTTSPRETPAESDAPAPARLSEAERAIRCYEHWSGLTVVVHDLMGGLEGQLTTTRTRHDQPLCRAMKTGPHHHRCVAWEINRLRPLLAAEPTGRILVCHAGLAEAVVPHLVGGRLALVLFAGQRLPAPGLPGPGHADLLVETDPSPTPNPFARHARLPVRWSAEDAAFALEGLRQLAARLGQLAHALPGRAWPESPARDRRRQILDFLNDRCTGELRLADLAAHLGLAPHRTAHVVRELCDRTFVALLTTARMRIAAGLLHTTDLAIPAIAKCSGFGDANHFHRLFRRHFGTTPHRYRSNGPES
jgi:AraC-like DNA-binding protein